MNYQGKALDDAREFVDSINASSNQYAIHRYSRPIANIKHMLESSEALYSNNIAFWQKFPGDEEFTSISYTRALADVNALGTALIGKGLKGKRIAVIGENCYYWAISYLAVVCGAGVVVPLDKELGENELRQLVENSEASCVICSPKYREMFVRMLSDRVGKLETVIDFYSEEDEGSVLSLKKLLTEGKAMMDLGNREFQDASIDEEAMGILLFTSGTTGIAKGVMLSHKNICTDLMAAPNYLLVTDKDLFFSVLPIHHTYECTCGFLMPLYKGAAIGFCEGLKHIQKNLKELKPTLFLGVPLIFESLYNAIHKNIKKQGKEKAVAKVLKLNRTTKKIGINLVPILLKDIINAFGGRMRTIISGGAAINPAILDFLNELGFIAVQGYGLTECSPMVALNPDSRKLMRNKSVGQVLPVCEAKIEDEGPDGIGEICIKGDNIMLGYYNMPEETAKSIVDGWFRTGDLGYMEDGFIYITGRKKNVIITGNGKNVYPEELEYLLSLNPFISESMVWADNDERGRSKAIVATLRPDMAEVEARLGEELSKDEEEIKRLLQGEVDRINEDLPLFKKINRVVLRMEDFDKSTSHKIKRFSEVNKKL